MLITPFKPGKIKISGLSQTHSNPVLTSSVQNSRPRNIRLKSYFSNLVNISEECLESVSDESIYSTIEVIDCFRRNSIASGIFPESPLANVDYDNSLILEYWFASKKLTLYIDEKLVDFLKVWGSDIEDQMEDGSINCCARDDLKSLWNWLCD